MKKILMTVLAAVFFILGVIGLLIPVIPQIPFFVISVLLMSAASSRFKKAFTETKLYKKHLEKHVAKHHRIEEWLNGSKEEGKAGMKKPEALNA